MDRQSETDSWFYLASKAPRGMYMIRRSNKLGFTLVEILIVVIILGILAAIVIWRSYYPKTKA